MRSRTTPFMGVRTAPPPKDTSVSPFDITTVVGGLNHVGSGVSKLTEESECATGQNLRSQAVCRSQIATSR